MADSLIVDPKVFDEHLEHLEELRAIFRTELREGLQACEERLYLLRVSLESTEEMRDEARRDLSEALAADEYRDIERVERLLDEVDDLTREVGRKRRALEEGTAAFRRLQDHAEKAEHDFSRAAFLASVSMSENKLRYGGFFAEELSANIQREYSAPPGAQTATRNADSRAATSDTPKTTPVRAYARPRLPNGMEWVPLESIDWSSIDDSMEFRKASRDDIRTMMRTFVEMIVPMLSVDPDLGPERLAAVDARFQRMPGDPESLVGTWERLISGSDRIALDTSRGAGQAVFINSGRHRILAARDIGLTHIPAAVSRPSSGEGLAR